MLKTKLRIPCLPNQLIKREAFSNLPNDIMLHSLTTVTAPAGSGKTTLLAQCIQNVQAHTAWVSLDTNDNDMATFLSCIILSIQQILPSVGHIPLQLISSPYIPPTDEILIHFINDIHDADTPILLCIDNYHIIDNQEVHEAIVFLLKHIPSHMHICILSRTLPPFNYIYLKGKGQVYEIEYSQLQFNISETVEFIKLRNEYQLTAEQADQVHSIFQGWITGLLLMSLYIKKNDVDLEKRLNSYMQTPTTSMNYIFLEYYSQLTPLHQKIVLYGAINPFQNLSLLQAITEETIDPSLLKVWTESGLFYEPMDMEQQWFRYQPLHYDLLKTKLQKEAPELISILHSRASSWFEENQLFKEAIEHAIWSQDWQKTISLIEEHATVFFKTGEYQSLYQWLLRIPVEFISNGVGVIYAWTEALMGYLDEAEARIHKLLSRPVPLDQAHSNDKVLKELTTILKYIKIRRKDYCEIYDATTTMELLPTESYLIFATETEFNPGEASLLRGWLGFCGRLKPAQSFFEQYMGYIQKYESIHAYHWIILSEIFYERNELSLSLNSCLKAMSLSEKGATYGSLVPSTIQYSKLLYTEGSVKASISQLKRGLTTVKKSRNPKWKQLIHCAIAEFYIKERDLKEAKKWLAPLSLDINGEIHITQEYEYITLISLLINEANYEDALYLTERLYELSFRAQRLGTMIEVLNLKAICQYQLENDAPALRTLHHGLILAQPEEYLRVYIDRGEVMKKLLEAYLASNLKGTTKALIAYISQLLQSFDVPLNSGSKCLLTKREITIIQLVASGLSNQEISEELHITLGTVKSHLNHVYSKLEVTNRTQAIARARELSFI